MVEIYYPQLVAVITLAWAAVRVFVSLRAGKFRWKREAQLLLVYICIVVVTRFTFFPFSRADGMIRPLVFSRANCWPPRINLIPLVYLTDYPTRREILLNLIGNITMMIPLGIVWPAVFPELRTHRRALLAGFGFPLAVELLQLPFFDRVTDIDDLLLNTLGFALGYGIYLLCRRKT